jgi:G3E family GTPase
MNILSNKFHNPILYYRGVKDKKQALNKITFRARPCSDKIRLEYKCVISKSGRAYMIKVNVVSGFLGAGKTTFIMRAAGACAKRNEKVVIIENEIGEAGIDAALLSEGGMSVYELLNGCICCTMKSDFITTFTEIKKLEPDRVFIEPSGVFMLDSLFDIFKRDELKGGFTLCPVITMVDARHFIKHNEAYSELLGGQVRLADKLILSKTQGMKDIALGYITQNLREMNDHADVIMDCLGLSEEEIFGLLKNEEGDAHCCGHEYHEHHAHSHSHGHEGHSHTAFETLLINPQNAYEREDILERLGRLSSGEYGSIIRAKGFLKSGKGFLSVNYVDGEAAATVRLLNVREALEIIGLRLDRAKLEALFE